MRVLGLTFHDAMLRCLGADSWSGVWLLRHAQQHVSSFWEIVLFMT